MAKKVKKRELGKGIRALLSNMESKAPAPEAEKEEVNKSVESSESPKTPEANTINKIPLNWIEINPYQPRKDFDPDALRELADSIKIHGLIQPITVRRMGHESYQLISGERRFRASKIAEMGTVPVYIRTANDQEMLEMALIENIQREDLNSIEVAHSYQRLIDECNLTHEEMSARIGKNRSTVTNYLRLLKLPPEIQTAIKEKALSMGHARALAGVEDSALQLMVFKRVKDEQLSVRELEKILRANPASPKYSKDSKNNKLPQDYLDVQDRLSSKLGSKVALKLKSKGKGSIQINFNSVDELNRLLDIIEDDKL